MATCLIGLGANLGDRAASLARAAELLAEQVGRLVAHSRVHPTTPAGGPAGQPEYLNAAAVFDTERTPQAVWRALQRIEQALGRRREQRWGPRTIDLDLLLFDTLVLDSPRLVIPHPRLAFRRFVLVPAAEVAAEMVHAPTGFTMRELVERLDRQPPHVVVLGPGAAAAAEAAAQRVGGMCFSRTGGSASRSPAAPETLEYLRETEQRWNSAAGACRAVVSDFWIGEVWSAAEELAEPPDWLPAWRAVPPVLAAPHLVVWIERSAGPPVGDAEERLRQRVQRPRQFPLLTCRDRDLDDVVAEIAGAVEAMESR